MTKIHLLLILLSLLASPAGTIAQSDPGVPSHAENQTLISFLEQTRADFVRQISPLEVLTPCFAGTVGCGQTVTGRVSVDSCVTSDSVYGVGYQFNGTIGQRVTLRSSSPSFRMGMALADGRTGNNTIYVDVRATANDSTAEISDFQLPYTGPYFIILSPLVPVTFGDYVLTVTCASAPPPSGSCTPNATTLCLNNGRFRVTATFLTPQSQSGNATAVPETTDTGMFWFFSANNIEAIIKVVNGCSFNQRYWVFAGGLTNVQVVLTVVDTLNGTTRTYTNPQGAAFQPIQDTNAFATCP